MKNNLKIYLAGAMMNCKNFDEMNKWRKLVTDKLLSEAQFATKVLEIINPVRYYNFEEKRHQSEVEVEEFDLAHVVSSDIVVANLEGLNNSVGTIIELHDAHYHNRIPVIAFGTKTLYDNLHPWVKNEITRIEKDIDGVVDYIRDFYLQ